MRLEIFYATLGHDDGKVERWWLSGRFLWNDWRNLALTFFF